MAFNDFSGPVLSAEETTATQVSDITGLPAQSAELDEYRRPCLRL
jgi:hypothetical protein